MDSIEGGYLVSFRVYGDFDETFEILTDSATQTALRLRVRVMDMIVNDYSTEATSQPWSAPLCALRVENPVLVISVEQQLQASTKAPMSEPSDNNILHNWSAQGEHSISFPGNTTDVALVAYVFWSFP